MTVIDQQVRYTIDGLETSTYAYYPMGLVAVDEFPTFRGDNPTLAGRHGRAFEQKVRDSRRFKLVLRVEHADSGGGITGTQPQQVRTNLDALYAVLGASGQRTIVRYMPDATTRTNYGEVVAVSDVQDPGGYGKLLIVSIEFDLANPLWYGSAVTPSATTINTSPKTISVTNAGTAPTSRVSFSCVGPLTNPRITNSTNGQWVQVDQVVASAKTLAIDCDTGVVTYDGTAVPSLVSHYGATPLLELAVGANSLSVTSSVTGGTVTPTHYPGYW